MPTGALAQPALDGGMEGLLSVTAVLATKAVMPHGSAVPHQPQLTGPTQPRAHQGGAQLCWAVQPQPRTPLLGEQVGGLVDAPPG